MSRAYGDGELSDASGTKKERPESAEQPIAERQVGCPLATTTKHDQLLLEHEILCHHRSYATAPPQLRGRNSQMQQSV